MTIIVGGYIIAFPFGGMTWHHLNYLVGLHELGHEVIFHEDSGPWSLPYNPVTYETSPDPSYGIEYFKRCCASVGLPPKFCYYSEPLDQYFGMTKDEWIATRKRADLMICVSGVTPWRDQLPRPKKTVIIDTDPVFTQLRMQDDKDFLSYYQLFDHVATFGTLVGTPDSPLPTHGIDWIPHNQPIALRHWPVTPVQSRTFSTIGKWEHTSDRHVEFAGKKYLSSKGVEWMKLLDLPKSSPFHLEMAMASIGKDDSAKFTAQGWTFTDAYEATKSIESFADFIQKRAGELTVAKQIYAGLPSGWFSDRSSCFLASGRPVITQSSGFEKWLPTGEGLFAFSDRDSAAAALREIDKDLPRHAKAARAIAEKYFDSRKVLKDLLDRVA